MAEGGRMFQTDFRRFPLFSNHLLEGPRVLLGVFSTRRDIDIVANRALKTERYHFGGISPIQAPSKGSSTHLFQRAIRL